MALSVRRALPAGIAAACVTGALVTSLAAPAAAAMPGYYYPDPGFNPYYDPYYGPNPILRPNPIVRPNPLVRPNPGPTSIPVPGPARSPISSRSPPRISAPSRRGRFRSWSRSPANTSRSTAMERRLPRARFRPGWRAGRRRRACSASSRRIASTIPTVQQCAHAFHGAHHLVRGRSA